MQIFTYEEIEKQKDLFFKEVSLKGRATVLDFDNKKDGDRRPFLCGKLMFIALLAAKPQTFSRGEGGRAKQGRKRNGEI